MTTHPADYFISSTPTPTDILAKLLRQVGTWRTSNTDRSTWTIADVHPRAGAVVEGLMTQPKGKVLMSTLDGGMTLRAVDKRTYVLYVDGEFDSVHEISDRAFTRAYMLNRERKEG